MAVINDGSNAGSGVYIDPVTGMPGKKKKKSSAVGFGYLTDPATGGLLGSQILVNGQPVTAGGQSTNVDLASILANDPSYQQFLADLQATSVSDRETLKAARQRALIQFGGHPTLNPTGLGEGFSGDITPEIWAAMAEADRSGVSTTARLQQAHQDALHQIRNSLLQRGMYFSGENAYNQGREAQQYRVAGYDATQKLIDYLMGVGSQYAQSEAERKRQKAEQERLALDQWLASHQDATGFGTGGQTPVPAGYPGLQPPDWLSAWQQYGNGYGGL